MPLGVISRFSFGFWGAFWRKIAEEKTGKFWAKLAPTS